MAVAAPPVAGEDWLNGDPLDWEDARARFVLLAFWSAECEASLHQLHELELLQQKWPDLMITAVHSPRAPYAADRETAVSLLARHRTTLRVLHDPALETWSRYNPSGWPATVLLGPGGKPIGSTVGAGVAELLDDVLGLRTSVAVPMDNLSPLTAPRPPAVPTDSPPESLLWPHAVTLLQGPLGRQHSSDDQRVAIADAGNRRILISSVTAENGRWTLKTHQVISGIGEVGQITSAGPGELLVTRPTLGEVWKINLTTHEAGPLRSGMDRPMGVCVDADGSVVVSDAVANQIFRITPDGACGVIAGSGEFGNQDGPAGRARLGQPVALIPVHAGLCFVDAATNNIRILTRRGQVVSVTQNSSGSYGLIDGPPHQAKFQRPSAIIELADRSLLVADTGNSRIRRITDRDVATVGASGLCRPEGLVQLADGTVLVADTGNHRLVALNLQTRSSAVVQPS